MDEPDLEYITAAPGTRNGKRPSPIAADEFITTPCSLSDIDF